MTYQQFFTVVDHLAAAWAAEIQGRDVAIFLPNSVAFLACYYAVLRAGGQPALINVGMPPESVKRLLADLKPVMTFSSQPIENFPGNAVTDAAVFELAATLNPAPVTPSTARPAEIGAILFSGGTTGLPKRIRHSHKVLMAKVERMEWGWPTNENEVWLPVAPFTHVYGYLMGVTNPILKGGRVVIPPPFQPDVIVDLLERQRVTVFGGGPPAIYQALLSSEKFSKADLSALRVCPGGGASFPLAVHRRWEDATGLKIYEGIGMTEIAPTAVNTLHSGSRPGTTGKPCPDTIIEIVDLDVGETVLPAGETGEIRVKGPHMMTGYDNNVQETALTLKHGFIYTGDIGLIDEEGFLHVTDRKKDVIFVKGFNVFPREVEEALMEHDQVEQAAVVGCEDERAGEVVVAFVKCNKATREPDLLSHCGKLLTNYKVPRRIELLDEFPLTAARKVDRNALRRLAKLSHAEA